MENYTLLLFLTVLIQRDRPDDGYQQEGVVMCTDIEEYC